MTLSRHHQTRDLNGHVGLTRQSRGAPMNTQGTIAQQSLVLESENMVVGSGHVG